MSYIETHMFYLKSLVKSECFFFFRERAPVGVAQAVSAV